MIESPEVGRRYRVTGKIKALCCEGWINPGEVVEVTKRSSKNRLLVKPERQGFHRVKRSTFRMNVEEIGAVQDRESEDLMSGTGKETSVVKWECALCGWSGNPPKFLHPSGGVACPVCVRTEGIQPCDEGREGRIG